MRDEEIRDEVNGEVEVKRDAQHTHENMAMTMERTRRKLEPQCDQGIKSKDNDTKLTTKKRL